MISGSYQIASIDISSYSSGLSRVELFYLGLLCLEFGFLLQRSQGTRF